MIGGTGLLSGAIMRYAVTVGYDVYIMNRGRNNRGVPGQVKILKADIHNAETVRSVLGDKFFDVVVDFIAYTPADLENSLALFHGHCKQFIFVSSACAYRRASEDGILTENSPLVNPAWDYSVNKVACEKLLIKKCKEWGMRYTIVRPYITYDRTRIPYGIMPPYGWHWTLIARIRAGKPIFLWDGGRAVCTLTHIRDFTVGFVGLFGNEKAFDEAFHIVGNERLTWKEVIELIGEQAGRKPVIVEIPSVFAARVLPEIKGMLLGDRALNACFDNTKICDAVPYFVPKVTAREGIAETMGWYATNEYLNGIDYAWEGRQDKLIASWCRQNGMAKGASLHFVGYLEKDDCLGNRMTYWANRRWPEFSLKGYRLLQRVIKKIVG